MALNIENKTATTALTSIQDSAEPQPPEASIVGKERQVHIIPQSLPNVSPIAQTQARALVTSLRQS